MFRVADISDEAAKLIGTCDQQKLFRWLSDSYTLISNKIDTEGRKGFLDICTGGCGSGCCGDNFGSTCNSPAGCGRSCVTLPREVETVIGVTIGGQPVLGYGQLFNFHINGPGDCRTTCEWKWQDLGNFYSTYRDIIIPANLVVYLQTAQDNGKQFIVYGYDEHGNKLRRTVGSQVLDGILIPTVFGYAIPDATQPKIARITAIYKDPSVGQMRLSTTDDSGPTGSGLTLGIYEPDEQIPQLRRIKLNRSCNWVRIAYIRTNQTFGSIYDHIPLKSRVGFLMAVQARKLYDEKMLADAQTFEATAVRLELEAQQMAEAPTYSPPMVIDTSNLRDKYDYDIR